MSEDNKKLTDQLVQAILPKLKGLTEKNAKKVLNETEKSITSVVKKYSKLIAEQEKEKAKAKHKAEKDAKKKAEKAAKKKEKEAKKLAKAKLLAALIAKEKPDAPAAPKKAPVVKAPAKPRARAPKAKK
ncbi:hypothetical protein [Aquirufa antheringensis]|uniref:hypothetical protein n=1 Tax=Aquirufa antheringensis TaxID=2516559 RepID=UPI001032E4B5|nr:hypothetical protein [Aquirufa antheringensis]MCE4217706.1 hypothetical protein [Pseudarcicella sp. GAP-15]MCZ2477621.1 hypothetical protein [Aquirufa antheringensis]TBH71401.1 hypothetical protein EWU21_03660 [Aquirufa antheringensis]